MNSKLWERKVVRFWLICIISFIISQVNLIFLFYLVPLHIIYRKWGAKDFLIAAGAVVAGIAIRSTILLWGLDDPELRSIFISIEIGFPVMFLLGLSIMIGDDYIRIPGVYRFLIAAAVIGIISLMIFPRFFYNDELTALIQGELERMGQIFQAGNTIEGGFDDAIIADYFESKEMIETMRDVFLSSFTAWFSLILLFFWRIGEVIISVRRRTVPPSLRKFYVPRELLWPVLFSWFLMILQFLIPMGFFRYIVWNAGLVLSILYALQGIGILQTLMDRFRFPRGFRILFGIVIMSLIFRPGANVVVMILIPALGVSETWIRYRNN